MLEEAVKMLPTPTSSDGEKVGQRYGKGDLKLSGAVMLLPTPTERDSINARNKTSGRQEDSQHHTGTTLSDVAYLWSGGRTVRQSGVGKRSSDLRLSPWFVEWMIGAPPGWSDPDCPLSATEFKSRWDAWPASTSSGSSGQG
jgi:hypothetical protein